jgi:addiction module HigA family antidote
MNMAQTLNEYEPNYAVVPGETILETLEDRGMTRDALAERLGLSAPEMASVLRAESAITDGIARGLERALDVPASFWLALERNYRDTLARLARARMAR